MPRSTGGIAAFKLGKAFLNFVQLRLNCRGLVLKDLFLGHEIGFLNGEFVGASPVLASDTAAATTSTPTAT